MILATGAEKVESGLNTNIICPFFIGGMMELKPCPFCGSIDIDVERKGTSKVSCIIACADCGCTLESNEIGYGYHWNRRVEEKEKL